MALSPGVRAGRRRARRNMPDKIAIYRYEDGELIEATGLHEQIVTTVYLGPGAVNTYEPHESTPVAGGHQFTVQRYSIKVPAEPAGIEINDVAVVLDAPMLPRLNGHEYTISGLHAITRGVSQRLLVDEEPA